MISKTTKLTKQGYQDVFESLVSFATIVMVSVYEMAFTLMLHAPAIEL